MNIIHITTEIKGGAGQFVVNLHETMMSLSLPSKLLTRERADIKGLHAIKPKSRIRLLSRSLILTLLSKAGIINNRLVEITYLDSEKITKANVKKLKAIHLMFSTRNIST